MMRENTERKKEMRKPREAVVAIGRSSAVYAERLSLCRQRLAALKEELLLSNGGAEAVFSDYFQRLLSLSELALSAYDAPRADAEQNRALYRDMEPSSYPSSYLNPAFARERLGDLCGPLLSAWYMEFYGLVPFAFERNTKHVTVLLETLLQLYGAWRDALCDGERADAALSKRLQDVFYSYLYDYCGEFTADYIGAGLVPGNSLADQILAQADLTDCSAHSYLYRYGEWVTEAELETARLLSGFSEETIDEMAAAYTEGYLRGFLRAGKDLSRKKTVLCYLPLGFERFMRRAKERFEEAGLAPVFRRRPLHLINKGLAGNVAPGFYGAENAECAFDHREDLALALGDRLKAEKILALKKAWKKYEKEAALLSGNACVETFGADGAIPEKKQAALCFTERQSGLMQKIRRQGSEISERYVPEEETSFTIIAWPRPQIAEKREDYPAIFADILRINTLPEAQYREIQQALCDALNQAVCAEIKGAGENRTALTVSLHPLSDRSRETNFENCLADVNVPLGEVFTSPRLSGTEGLLFVSRVYLSSFLFKDLFIRFADGRVTDYGCANFADPEEGRRLMRRQIFRNEEHLPMGEFAIGTNTTAYSAAKKWGIEAKLPVLIAEKTGPHFAVGDTCYAHEEDVMTYNPDGKAITARSNECADLRHTEPDRAYFHTHVDITLPYEELGSLCAVCADGTRIRIIENGRFVLPGTEALNAPFDGKD